MDVALNFAVQLKILVSYDDEADARRKFVWMPFYLGDHPARSRPASYLVGEACVGPAHVIRRAANGAFEQICDPFLQDAVGGQTDRIFDPLRLQILVNLGICEAGVGAKIKARDLALITRNDRLQHALPTIGAMNVPGTQRALLQIAELVEHKQRMITGAGIVPIPDAHLLLAMGRADARIHIENDASGRSATM